MDLKKYLDKAKAKVTGRKKDQEKKFEVSKAASYPILERVWPKGTWTLEHAANTPRTDNDSYKGWPMLDFVVHGVLLDVWWLEAFVKAEEAAGRKLNPGMFGEAPDTMPADWLPSKKIVDHYIAKSPHVSPASGKHILDRLTALKHIRP